MKVISEIFVFGDGDVAENENQTGGRPITKKHSQKNTKGEKIRP